MEDLIFSLEAHSSKELRHFKFLCVSFMAQLLSSSRFIQQVGRKNPLELEDGELHRLFLKPLLRFRSQRKATAVERLCSSCSRGQYVSEHQHEHELEHTLKITSMILLTDIEISVI